MTCYTARAPEVTSVLPQELVFPARRKAALWAVATHVRRQPVALAADNRSGTRRDRRAVDPVSMRHNQAIAGALVAALLACLDIVGCAQCVAYCWPYFGLKSFLIAAMIRSKFKNATPAARAGLPRIGFAPYEFVGGDSVGLVFYPGPARRGSDHEAYVLNLIFTQVRSSRRPRTPRSAGAWRRRPRPL